MLRNKMISLMNFVCILLKILKSQIEIEHAIFHSWKLAQLAAYNLISSRKNSLQPEKCYVYLLFAK